MICIQEIKAQKNQINPMDFELAGYPHQYWFSAEKKGYSGVAILSKIKPNHVEYGTGIETMDFEGRNIRVDFDQLSVMSMYLPSGTNDASWILSSTTWMKFLIMLPSLGKVFPIW